MKWYIILFRMPHTGGHEMDWKQAQSAEEARDLIIEENFNVGVTIKVLSIISTEDRPKVEWDW